LKAAFRARKRGRFERLFTVFFLCNGFAIKGRGVSSVGSNAYSLKAAVTTGSGVIKGERSEPTSKGGRGEETGEKASVPSFALVFRAQIHRQEEKERTGEKNWENWGELDPKTRGKKEKKPGEKGSQKQKKSRGNRGKKQRNAQK